MQRRSFFRAVTTASLSAPLVTGRSAKAGDASLVEPTATARGSFAIDAEQVRFFSSRITLPLNVMVVADTHLFTDDERGKPFQQYSKRMAGAYNQTRHFRTGEVTTPVESFEQTLRRAKETEVDLLALVGDLFSFPSEAAIDWVQGKLASSGVPYLYVAGNHDWHYEGMPGSLDELRDQWIEKRLKPLYQGNNPLMAAYDVKGVRFLAIDNSQYEISPAQLQFFRTHANSEQPIVLLVHIPLYAPGRPMGFGCGNPKWGASTDRNFTIERRPKWPRSGHTQTTMDFHREVFDATNLLGIFAGHIHRQSVDVVNGIPQFVTNANAVGASLEAEFLPR